MQKSLLDTRASTSNKIAAGGLISTLEDISRFAIALQTGKLLGSAAVEQMWTLQKTNDGQAIPYALGWRIAERNGMKEVFHGGAGGRIQHVPLPATREEGRGGADGQHGIALAERAR